MARNCFIVRFHATSEWPVRARCWGNLRQRIKAKYCTHNIAFAPLAAAVVHNMKITSFAYYWAVEIMEAVSLRPRRNVEFFIRRTKR